MHCLTNDRNVKVTVRVVGDRSTDLSVKSGDSVQLLPDMSKAVTFG